MEFSSLAVWGLEFKGLGFKVWVSGFGFRVWGGFRVYSLGFKIWGLWFMIYDLGFGV